MFGWMLAVMLGLQAVGAAPALDTKAVDAKIAEMEAVVRADIAAEHAAIAKLPPAANDSERLVRMMRIEQAGREALDKVDDGVAALSEADRRRAWTAIWQPLIAEDKANQKALLAMVPPEGWFYKSKYGPEAARAAFLIVQHGDLEMWRRFVPVLEPLVAKGEVDGQSYGLMYDRLALSEGRLQRYGSQMLCKNGKLVADKLEDPATVDERRKAMGFKQTLAEYEAFFANRPPCG